MTEQRTAVIVGGTGNVGRECVRIFTQEGFQAWTLSRHAPEKNLGSGFWKNCDVTNELAFRGVLEDVLGRTSNMAVLVYTPSLPPDADVELAACPMEVWDKTLAIHTTGFLIGFQEGLRLMRPGSHIVAVGSAVTRFDWQHLPPIYAGHYSAAKAALNELCKWGRREAHKRGLLLSRIAPGALDVPYHREAPEERRPKATLPVPALVRQIVDAVNEGRELDLEVVAPL